jgi:signal transduction histidine kinase
MTEQYDSKLFAEFFDWQPQPFVWLQPVWDDGDKKIVDFRYVYSNALGLEYLKLSREMLGNICISNTPSLNDEMRPRIFNEMLQVYNTGQTITVDMYNPVIDKYGTVYRLKFRDGVLTTIQGKTNERRAIIELDKRTKELQQLNDSLKEFAYVASHDLQEPLRKITTFVAKLSKELPELNDSQKNIFDRIESATVRMKALIDDLLSYSLVNIQPDKLKTIDLQQVVSDILQHDFEVRIKEANVKISIDPLPAIKADASQMRQLFQNLISNAFKYRTREGTATIIIRHNIVQHTDPSLTRFTDLENKTYHLIEVIDNGIGFNQEHAENIFQVFQRLHNRSEYEGTGIGLAIVQRVVHNHHGFIKATSSVGKGATFQILLPVD